MDGWCREVLIQEVFSTYQAYARGEAPALNQTHDYRSYIEWMQAQDPAKAESFWREELGGVDSATRISIERPNSAGEGKHGECRLTLRPEVTEKIEHFARQQRVTVNSVVQAGWALLLGRYSGTRDIIFGATVSGRSVPVAGVAMMMGLFINTLPVRVKLKGELTTGDFVRDLQNRQTQARQYEYSSLVEVQRCCDIPSGQPLFENILVFDRKPINDATLSRASGGLCFSGVRVHDVSHYPLMLSASYSGGLDFSLHYSMETYAEQDAQRLLNSLAHILDAFATSGDAILNRLDLLSPEDGRLTLGEWSGTFGSYHFSSVYELFREQAQRRPDAMAVRWSGGGLTYAELNRRACGLASRLRDEGVGREDRVAIYLNRSADALAAILAVMKAGASYVPLDPAHPRERLDHIAKDANLRGILTSEDLASNAPASWAPRMLVNEIQDAPDVLPGISVGAEDLAYVMYTSGSTGRPKGVMVRHGGLTNFLLSMLGDLEMSEQDVLLAVTTLSFDISGLELLLPLICGGCVVIADHDAVVDGRSLAALADGCGVTLLQATPMTWQLLREAGWLGRRRLRAALCGGEVLTEALAADLLATSESVWNLYGPTETTIWSTAHRLGADAVRIGKPIANTTLYVLDEDGELAPAGVSGELYIGGEGVARGYIHQPGLTAERFLPDPFSRRSGARLYRTGDRVRWCADGSLEYLGRLDNQVKLRGFRIELEEIEAVLAAEEQVADGAVVLDVEQSGGPRLVAFVVEREVGSVDLERVREALRQKLPGYMLPSAMVKLRALPLTPSGKVDRRLLSKLEVPAEAGDAVRAGAPLTAVEELLAGIWSELLSVEQVRRQDHFFEIGGHSLLAMQMTSRVRQTFRVDLQLRTVFDAPRLRQLAAVIAAAQQDTQLSAPIVPVERRPEMPLSFAQQRLWFMDQLTPGSPLYNEPMGVRLRGDLDLGAVQTALNEIVKRHEVLRTVFAERDGQPVQIIREQMPLTLSVIDLRGLPPDEQEERIQALAHEEAVRGFDLTTGPLLRSKVLRLAAEDHILLCTLHHIVCDGWSTRILVRELSEFYNAFRQMRPSPLAPLSLQYVDFAVWQREQLGSVIVKQLEYWRDRLSLVPPMELPCDWPRATVQTYRGARETFDFGPELSSRLAALSRSEDVTMFMLLLAALNALLVRYTGEADISIATALADRRHAELEPLVGFFTNTLVLRTKFSRKNTFRELLTAVREVALGAYANQDVPFEQVVEHLRRERDVNLQPLFQILLIFQDMAGTRLDMQSLAVEPFALDSGTAKLDLSFAVFRNSGQIGGLLEYNSDLYSKATIRRLLEHLTRILRAVVDDVEIGVTDIELLTGEEGKWLSSVSTGRQKTLPLGRAVHQLVRTQAALSPDRVAVVAGDRQLTYAQLQSRADTIATELRRLGAGLGKVVGIALPRSEDLPAAVLGVLSTGAAYLPLDPNYPLSRLQYVIGNAEPAIVLTSRQQNSLFADAGVPLVYLEDISKLCHGAPDVLPGISVGAEDLAYVMYTSGSTGRPKGVMVRHGGLMNFLLSMLGDLEMSEQDVLLAVTTLSFDLSSLELLLPLICGARVVIADHDAVVDGRLLAALADSCGATLLQATPMTWRLLSEAGWLGRRRLRAALCGAEVLTEALAADLLATSESVWNLYGPTEITVWATAHRLGADAVRIGKPIANTTLYVLDEDGELAPAGVSGELYIGGEGVARGYIHQPGLTAERFLPDPFSRRSGARLYRTGDRVHWCADGVLEYLGRLDNQVKLRGFRIELEEIEAVLRQQKGVRAAAVAVREQDTQQELVAYVVRDNELTAEELQIAIGRQLPKYMVPVRWAWIAELPLNTNGKLNRKRLPEMELFLESGTSTLFDAPPDPVEEILIGLWSQVLHRDAFGIHQDFFALGGHSLLGAQLMARIREAFQIELPLRALFDAPTIAGLAEHIRHQLEAQNGAQMPPLPSGGRPPELPLSFAQQRLWFLNQMDPHSSAYNMHVALKLRAAALDRVSLEWALNQVLERHEVLRTHFEDRSGRPVQVIDQPVWLALMVEDGAALTCAELNALRSDEASRPFELSRGPLLRSRLVRTDANEHILLLTVHHIACDGWSLQILEREIRTLYEARVRNRAVDLPRPRIQYADFALWQRHWLVGDVLQQQLSYWEQNLREVPAELPLPADRRIPAMRSDAGGAVTVRIDPALTAAIRRVSRESNASTFMVLLAGWQVLLGRLTGSSHVVTGTAVAGRPLHEFESSIGLFVNQLPIATDLGGKATFRDVIGRVRESCLSAYAHQHLPFEQIVAALRPARTGMRNPLSQTLVALEFDAVNRLLADTIEMEALPAPVTSVKYDLALWLREHPTQIDGALEYSSELFQGATPGFIRDRYLKVLQTLVLDASQYVDAINVLSEPEQQTVVQQWNQTSFEMGPDHRIEHLFERAVNENGAAAAVESGGIATSYQELNQRANRLARHLQRRGIGVESRVGLFFERSSEMLTALLGVLKAGATYVPLDPGYPGERVRFMLQDSGAVLVLTSPKFCAALQGTQAEIVCLSDIEEACGTESGEDAAPAGTGENLAYVLYTSGSTGQPKGVMVTDSAVTNFLCSMRRLTSISNRDVLLAVTTICFDIAGLELFLPLSVGARVVIASRDTAADGTALAAEMERCGATFMQATPITWRMLCSAGWRPTVPLAVLCGGEAWEEDLAAALLSRSATVLNLYGPTETTIWSSTYPVTDTGGGGWSIVPIGRPISNTQMYVLDREMDPVPVGLEGELYIGGAGVARGYWGQPARTAEQFVPNPFTTGGGRLYTTGDRTRWNGNGQLEYLGRGDEQVKFRGYRIEVGEIEAVLRKHHGVRAAAVGLRGQGAEQELIAYVVRHSSVSVEELSAAVQRQLPRYMTPARWLWIDDLPHTANGKLDRKLLAAIELPPAMPVGAAPQVSHDSVEEILVSLWAQVLEREEIGISQDFFDLGGHSLLGTQLMARIRDVFQVEVPLRVLFDTPTVEALARHIRQGLGAQDDLRIPMLSPGERPSVLPLSFAQQRLWMEEYLSGGETGAYNMHSALRVRGALDVEALRKAMTTLLARHEALRTHFEFHQGGPVQIIDPCRPFELAVEDGRSLTGSELCSLRSLEAVRPFDLTSGPLLRTRVVRVGDQEYLLLMTVHHIACDAWSLNILDREIRTLYIAYVGNRAAELPSLPVQYADYAVWQRRWLEGDVMQQQLTYWRRHLSEVPAELPLPWDLSRPELPSFRGGAEWIRIEPDQMAGMRRLSRETNCSMFMVLLAAWQILLARISGHDRVVTGVDVAGRRRSELESLIGFFVNQLPLVTNLAGNPSFREVLARVRESCLALYAHQDVPFDAIVNDLRPQRRAGLSPWMNTKLVYLNLPRSGPAAGDAGVAAEPLQPDQSTVRFDLTIFAIEEGERMNLLLQYALDIFSHPTGQGIAAELRALLDDLIHHPDLPVRVVRELAVSLAK